MVFCMDEKNILVIPCREHPSRPLNGSLTLLHLNYLQGVDFNSGGAKVSAWVGNDSSRAILFYQYSEAYAYNVSETV